MWFLGTFLFKDFCSQYIRGTIFSIFTSLLVMWGSVLVPQKGRVVIWKVPLLSCHLDRICLPSAVSVTSKEVVVFPKLNHSRRVALWDSYQGWQSFWNILPRHRSTVPSELVLLSVAIYCFSDLSKNTKKVSREMLLPTFYFTRCFYTWQLNKVLKTKCFLLTAVQAF